jgi:hypothetical protein
MGTGSFPGVKRPGCGVDHPPPSRAKVKERVELIPLLPLWAFVACSRVNLTFTFIQSIILTFNFSHFIHFQYTRDLWVLWWYCISVGNMHLGSRHALHQQNGFLLYTGVKRMAMVHVHMNAICMTAGDMHCTE